MKQKMCKEYSKNEKLLYAINKKLDSLNNRIISLEIRVNNLEEKNKSLTSVNKNLESSSDNNKEIVNIDNFSFSCLTSHSGQMKKDILEKHNKREKNDCGKKKNSPCFVEKIKVDNAKKKPKNSSIKPIVPSLKPNPNITKKPNNLFYPKRYDSYYTIITEYNKRKKKLGKNISYYKKK